MTHPGLLLAATLLLLPVAATAQTSPPPAGGMAMPMAAPTTAGPADQALSAAMDGMMKNMQAAPSGNPDRDFATMMIPHHQGAIDMAKVELQYGKDPTLRRLARDIVAAQQREIAIMRKYLAGHGK